jgi:quercetin dioxygenase-like cupin family protein
MDSSTPATIRVGAISIDFLVDADDSGGSVTVFECVVPADAQVPIAHSHDAFEETIYGLEGACSWTIDGQARDVGPGESVCIRRGQVHGFENPGSVDAKFLGIATPGVFGPAYFPPKPSRTRRIRTFARRPRRAAVICTRRATGSSCSAPSFAASGPLQRSISSPASGSPPPSRAGSRSRCRQAPGCATSWARFTAASRRCWQSRRPQRPCKAPPPTAPATPRSTSRSTSCEQYPPTAANCKRPAPCCTAANGWRSRPQRYCTAITEWPS